MKPRYIFLILLLLCVGVSACRKVAIGYLRADDAEFVPNTVFFYHTPSEGSPKAIDARIPWTSIRIQGVSGTSPINYEFQGVKVSQGGDAEKFEAMHQAGHLNVGGGIVQISQQGVRMLPKGVYKISLRVFNDGHERRLEDILTIVVDLEEENPSFPLIPEPEV